MEGGWFSTCGTRLSASKTLQKFHGWKASGFQNVAPGLAPRAFVQISLAKNPTMCSCEHRNCGYRLPWSSLWGHET
eukprot:5510645-Pyramimonas_sp.AAC.1